MRLSQFCRDDTEASLLQHICSKGDSGKKLWRHFVEEQVVGVAELLELFPSCYPPLDQLLCACSAMPPRCYSIASSPLKGPKATRIAFSVVKYCCRISIPGNTDNGVIHRKGLCSNYLEHVLKPWLCGMSATNMSIRIFHKPTIHFKLPGSTSFPLILIGPGTGVAPFIGFLEQREALEKERQLLNALSNEGDAPAANKQRSHSGTNSNILTGAKECCMGEWRGGIELEDLPVEGTNIDKYRSSVSPGDIWLFYGCRNTMDFLYQVQMIAISISVTSLDFVFTLCFYLEFRRNYKIFCTIRELWII